MGSWWVPSRIEAAVTRPYVLSQLLPDEIERLDRPVAFGDEQLTERTYWDSIREDAPRLFLILVDLGVPDQIFGVIDDGWDDAELPIALEDVDRLQLTATRDDRVNRKFYHRQFHFLLKTLERGSHSVYSDQDVVPLDIVDRPPITPHKAQLVDKVKLPNVSNTIFCRRRYPLGNGPGCIPPQEFLDAIQSARGLQNNHVVSYWASYTHHGYGYVLFTPTTDFTLKSFLATTPSSFKNLRKKARRELIMNWILCLADTMCFLHSKNRSHCYIKPSTILFNNQNHICLADSTRLTPDSLSHQTDSKSSFDREWYDYAAPEQWFRPTGASSPPLARMSTMPSASTSPTDGFSIMRGPDLSNSPNAMLLTPNPQLSPQQADIFSLGCVILELLSFLVKRSTSKFASFRSAKHKTAGRGGAVLDTSFHRNLGQVEAWMSNVAKDASKKVSDSEGGNAFKGVTPILHVVTGMLSANPHDRPPAIEVQQRIYQVVTEVCAIQEPHCVHQYSHELDYALGRMRIQTNANVDPAVTRRYHRTSIGYGTPRTFNHSRESSSGGYSQTSRTTISSEAEADGGYNAAGPSSPQRGLPPSSWARDTSYLGTSSFNQPSLYAAGS
ncbi:Fc.00g002760.m01.CDS01 [Cosmosporella sp. VM-42]